MIRWVNELRLERKRVFLRVDFNVPMKNGRVLDATRIQESMATIRWISKQQGTVVLASHLGRPEGSFRPEYSLKPAAEELERILHRRVTFIPECVGLTAEEAVSKLKPGEVACLENLRFHSEEEGNEPNFAAALARLADVYIDDAFGATHRAHASISGITKYLTEKGGGFLLKKEIEALSSVLSRPDRPFVAMLGGAKVSDKIEVLQNLAAQLDRILIGGAMALTLLHARGLSVGRSRIEHDKIGIAREFLTSIERQNKTTLLLPSDHVVVHHLNEKDKPRIVDADDVPADMIAVDIGPKTVQAFEAEIERAKTVVWNGPMGIFEVDAFSNGTMSVARAVARSRGMTLVGGGDSVAALAKARCKHLVRHVSTGGGATLEFLAGKKLPGILALES